MFVSFYYIIRTSMAMDDLSEDCEIGLSYDVTPRVALPDWLEADVCVALCPFV